MGLKAMYFQGVEILKAQVLSTRGGQPDVFNLHHLTVVERLQRGDGGEGAEEEHDAVRVL